MKNVTANETGLDEGEGKFGKFVPTRIYFLVNSSVPRQSYIMKQYVVIVCSLDFDHFLSRRFLLLLLNSKFNLVPGAPADFSSLSNLIR